MRIVLLEGPWSTFILRSQMGKSLLVQFETDIVGVAQTFGWPGTDDGTPESRSDAFDFLSSRVGESTDDPGYF
jgi:hypothetical protein